MTKLLAACAVSLVLAGCATRDLCHEEYVAKRPTGMTQADNDYWNYHLRMCRMMDASIRYGGGNQVLEVRIVP
jgi:hypothetical protein